MRNISKPVRILCLLGLAVFITALIMGSGALPSLGKPFVSPIEPPAMSESGAMLSPLGTPVARGPVAIEESIDGTALADPPDSLPTPVPPTASPTIPPPPGYPTDEPWPPQATPQPSRQTETIHPFPTPAFPASRGKRPAALQAIWFPYYPDAGTPPQIQASLVDRQGQQWGQSSYSIDLGLDLRHQSGTPLLGLHPSPDRQRMVADIAFRGSALIDLASGDVSYNLAGDSSIGQWYFYAWHPDNRHILAVARDGLLLVDLVSREYEILDYYSQPEFEYARVSAMAYAPDGTQMADAVIYPAVYGVRDAEVTEIGIRDGDGSRRPIVTIPGGINVLEHSLRWSPDGRRLIWVADVVPTDIGVSIGLKDVQTQLWVADLDGEEVRMMGILSAGAEYAYPPAWSPDGKQIAALKAGGIRGEDALTSIVLFDAKSGGEQQVARFPDRLSNLTWSPDGQWLVFTVSKGEYGEVWVISSDGTLRHPVAGPTTPDAPFTWVPTTEGGK